MFQSIIGACRQIGQTGDMQPQTTGLGISLCKGNHSPFSVSTDEIIRASINLLKLTSSCIRNLRPTQNDVAMASQHFEQALNFQLAPDESANADKAILSCHCYGISYIGDESINRKPGSVDCIRDYARVHPSRE